MTTPTMPMRNDTVAGYVAAVRARLSDLSGEEVEELTGGLEADLAEALAGSGASPHDVFGDPVAYADELRAAAGLPPRARSSAWSSLDARWRAVQQHRFWPPVRDFLVVLRPVWWVLRAWVAYRMIFTVLGGEGAFPGGGLGFLWLVAFVVVSVELGRRGPHPSRGLNLAVTAGNVLAVMLLVFALGAAGSPRYDSYAESYAVPTGLSRDGEQIYNVFPFDAQGNPLKDVRLYDERGRALVTGEGSQEYYDGNGTGWSLVPRDGLSREQSWNVYPLQRQEISTDDEGNEVRTTPQDAPVPFGSVPPLLAAPAPVQPSASASATPGPRPTEEPSAAPTATAPAAATPGPGATVTP